MSVTSSTAVTWGSVVDIGDGVKDCKAPKSHFNRVEVYSERLQPARKVREPVPKWKERAQHSPQVVRFLSEPTDFRSRNADPRSEEYRILELLELRRLCDDLEKKVTLERPLRQATRRIPMMRKRKQNVSEGSQTIKTSSLIPKAELDRNKLGNPLSLQSLSNATSGENEVLLAESAQDSSDESGGDSEVDSLDDSDAVEGLNALIFQALAPDFKFAAAVVAHLSSLPAHLRAFVYGFTGHGQSKDNSATYFTSPNVENTTGKEGSSSNPTPYKKRGRAAAGRDDDTDDEKRPKNGRSKLFKKAQLQALKFACPFYIKYPDRYCVRNEVGGTGELYRTCMGTGWKELRHLKDHLRDIHRPVQCSRCWEILDNIEALDYHKDKMEPRCQDASSDRSKQEGIKDASWPHVEAALKTRKSKTADNTPEKRDEDKWMEVWEILFPHDMYPDDPKPDCPYYVNQRVAGKPLETYTDIERVITLAKSMWDEAVAGTCHGDASQGYHPTQTEACEWFRQAAAICFTSNLSTPEIEFPTGNAQTRDTNSDEATVAAQPSVPIDRALADGVGVYPSEIWSPPYGSPSNSFEENLAYILKATTPGESHNDLP